MGEIGFPRREFLHDIRWWEVRSILRGYNRRHRNLWSATRWQTYHLMCVSMADITMAGINRPTDLIQFPWERDTSPPVSQQDIDELLAEIDAINHALDKEKETPKE